MTIRLSSGKECLLTWLGELPMKMTNGSLNDLIYNSGILMVNTLPRHLLVDHIMFKVLRPVLVPSSILSVMDGQIHPPILHLSCLHGRSIPRTNSQHQTQRTSHIQEILLINTSRVSTSRISTTLTNQNQSHSWHNPWPLTVRCLRLFHHSRSSPEHTLDPWKRMSRQLQVVGTNKFTTIHNILP